LGHLLYGVELRSRQASSAFPVVGEDIEDGAVFVAEFEDHPKQRANTQKAATKLMCQQMVSSLAVRKSKVMIAPNEAKTTPTHKPKLIPKSASNTLVNVVKGALSGIVQAGIIEDDSFRGGYAVGVVS
jgi:hypothetical protein